MKKLFISLCGLIAYSCDFQKDVIIKLPPYEKELVVECYIERGKPLRMLLLETDGYFDTLRFPLINNAKVAFSFNGVTDIIKFFPFFDFPGRKLFNYNTPTVPNYDTNAVYNLTIEDSLGRKLEGQTRFLKIQEFDSIDVKYNSTDSLARFLMYVNDFPGESNYYRVIFNEDSLTGSPVLEFEFSDRNLDGQRFPIGTSFRFKSGKTMYIRLYHLEKQYFDYLESIESANRANGNPFAQPATILSPMKGNGYGIFTTINMKMHIVKY